MCVPVALEGSVHAGKTLILQILGWDSWKCFKHILNVSKLHHVFLHIQSAAPAQSVTPGDATTSPSPSCLTNSLRSVGANTFHHKTGHHKVKITTSLSPGFVWLINLVNSFWGCQEEFFFLTIYRWLCSLWTLSWVFGCWIVVTCCSRISPVFT